jgi:hypothetical protein
MPSLPRVLSAALASLLLGWASAGAQEQEKKLLDRIQNPDRTLANSMQGKSYGATGTAATAPFQGGARSFSGGDKAAVKSFTDTRSFFGIKNPWFGSKVHTTRESPLVKKGSQALVERAFPVSNADTRTSPLASKKSPSATGTVPTGEFALRGAAQGALDTVTDKVHRKMTIDDVRELLNNAR